MKELEDTMKHQKNKRTAVNPDKIVYKCENFEFIISSKIRLSIHAKRMHTLQNQISY